MPFIIRLCLHVISGGKDGLTNKGERGDSRKTKGKTIFIHSRTVLFLITYLSHILVCHVSGYLEGTSLSVPFIDSIRDDTDSTYLLHMLPCSKYSSAMSQRHSSHQIS